MKRKHIFLSIIPLGLSLVSCNQNKYSMDKYILTLPYKDNFKIMQLADTHIRPGMMQEHLDFIDKMIEDKDKQKPDLIIHTGDSIIEASKEDYIKMFDYFDSKKIPWTLLFGNHEARALFTMDWLTGELNRRHNETGYCQFVNYADDNVHGDCNFAINLVDSSLKVKHQIICIDSNRYRDDYYIWDYIRPDQIEWYENLVNYTTKENNGVVVPSYIYTHIPIPEYKEAWEHRYDEGAEFDGGICYDDVKPAKVNSGLFKKMKELNSTIYITCGHEHANNFKVKYQGINFCYGIKSADNHYIPDHPDAGQILGCRTLIIKADNTLLHERNRYQYEGHPYGPSEE